MNRFTSGLSPKVFNVLRPGMKFRKRIPIFLRQHDLRRPKIHPVSVFFFFFEVSPADVNLVPKYSSIDCTVVGSVGDSVPGHVPGHVHGCVHRIYKIGEPSF